jgi:carbonic anhydrase
MRPQWKTWIVIVAVIAVVPAIRAQWRTPWTYEGPRGPEHWSELDPEYTLCNTGRAQSPIDIRDAVEADLAPLEFAFPPAPLKFLINNGATVRVNYHDAPGAGRALTVGGKRYQLTQFHFHRPSEEFLDGRQFAMDVHFMFESDDHAVAGVAVLVNPGNSNDTVAQIFAAMPTTAGPEHEVPGVTIGLATLLPSVWSYYEYEGSVTAPPCTEGVRWFVLRRPIQFSPDQIAAFVRLYPNDARPRQPLNGRVVKESR